MIQKNFAENKHRKNWLITAAYSKKILYFYLNFMLAVIYS